jgi:hypothetical protein
MMLRRKTTKLREKTIPTTNNNKQKLGRELVGTGKGRRGRQGTW